MTTERQQSDEFTGGQVVPRVHTKDAGSQVDSKVILGCDVRQNSQLGMTDKISNAFKINSFRKFATKLLSSFLAAVALIFSDDVSRVSKNITEEKPDSLGNINENAKEITKKLNNNNNNELSNLVIITAALFFIRILAGGFKRLCSTSEPEKRDVCTQADTIFTESQSDDESGCPLGGAPSSSLRDPDTTTIGKEAEGGREI